MTYTKAAPLRGGRLGDRLSGVWATVCVAACASLLGCGGNSRVDTQPQSSGGSGGAGGTIITGSGGDGAEGGGGTTTTTTTTTTATGQCEGQPCGAVCQVCEPDCLGGHCDGAGSCVAWDFAGSNQCPPSGEVASGVACSLEGVLCPSDSSCSGALLCMCSEWTLINPC